MRLNHSLLKLWLQILRQNFEVIFLNLHRFDLFFKYRVISVEFLVFVLAIVCLGWASHCVEHYIQIFDCGAYREAVKLFVFGLLLRGDHLSIGLEMTMRA